MGGPCKSTKPVTASVSNAGLAIAKAPGNFNVPIQKTDIQNKNLQKYIFMKG